jgi:hypothetical protein
LSEISYSDQTKFTKDFIVEINFSESEINVKDFLKKNFLIKRFYTVNDLILQIFDKIKKKIDNINLYYLKTKDVKKFFINIIK